MTLKIAAKSIKPTPKETMTIRIQFLAKGNSLNERTSKFGPAMVVKRPIKTAPKQSKTKVFFLVKLFPTIVPILPMDLSAPKLKRAKPITKGTIEIKNETKTGPR